MKTLIETLKHIVHTLQTQIPGCVPVSVGGSVRDAIMYGEGNFEKGLSKYVKDFDLEIFKATPKQVELALAKEGFDLELVGLAFPVYKVRGYNIDISFPRRESSTGEKHTDFTIQMDPDMTFAEAALRRDFTVNAIGYDWTTNTILDPYNGLTDLRRKILNPVSLRFKEDALRVLRAFKFIGRYAFIPSDTTIAYCKEITPLLANYARERMQAEWIDFVMNSYYFGVRPAFEFLKAIGIQDIYPELMNMVGVQQHPRHHPEGDVYEHTVYCFEAFTNSCFTKTADDRSKLVVGFAVLCHDMGKSITTQGTGEGITAHGHEKTPLARRFMERLFHPADPIIMEVEELVEAHMRPGSLYKAGGNLSAVRRLNVAVSGRMDRLLQVVQCDQMGRPGKPVDLTPINWLLEKMTQCQMKASTKIEPIIKGRHIIEHLKIEPGPAIGKLVKQLFEAQLDGQFNDESSGLAYLKANCQG